MNLVRNLFTFCGSSFKNAQAFRFFSFFWKGCFWQTCCGSLLERGASDRHVVVAFLNGVLLADILW